jgi:hypothetical protein
MHHPAAILMHPLLTANTKNALPHPNSLPSNPNSLTIPTHCPSPSQLAVLEADMAILDEIDSGLDIDALRDVAKVGAPVWGGCR